MNHKIIVANQHEVSIDGGYQQQNYHKSNSMKAETNQKNNGGQQQNDNKSKSTKRDDGRPRKNLSAYNILFKIERNRIIKEQANTVVVPSTSTRTKIRAGKRANVGFANLARIVADKWKNVDTATKHKLIELASVEKARYQREMEEWRLTNEEENEETTKVFTESPILSDKDSKDFMFSTVRTVESKKESLTKSDSIAPPFKFDEFDPSATSIFCFPCSGDPSVTNLKQQSVLQPETQCFLPGYYSAGRMNNVDTPMQFTQAHYDRHVSSNCVIGEDFAAPVTAFCNPCVPSPITVFGNQMFHMENNHAIIPKSHIATERLMAGDVDLLRDLYESRMRRKSVSIDVNERVKMTVTHW